EIPGQTVRLPGPRRCPVEQQQCGECGQTVRRPAEGDGHPLHGRGNQRLPALAEPLPDAALPEPQLLAVPPLRGNPYCSLQRPRPLKAINQFSVCVPQLMDAYDKQARIGSSWV